MGEIYGNPVVRGEVELTFNPSFLPFPCPYMRAFYPSPVRISMARRLPVISHSGCFATYLGNPAALDLR